MLGARNVCVSMITTFIAMESALADTPETETTLIGNAVITNPIKNNLGEIVEFAIHAPRGKDIKVNLNGLSLYSTQPSDNKQLRQAVYDTYNVASKNVPAFTPLIECLAESTSSIQHTDANIKGMMSGYINHNSDDNALAFNIKGNPNPQDKVISFESNGIKYSQVLEQREINYLGADKLWHKSDALELITHEIAHGCKKLQDLSSEGALAYKTDKLKGVVPEDEKRVKTFINKIILEPRGMPNRDLGSDEIKKPMDATVGEYVPLDKSGLELLKHGPIPIELKEYSHPTLKDLHSHVENPQQIVFARIAEIFNNNLMLNDKNQQKVI